jgi:hypothetical protein
MQITQRDRNVISLVARHRFLRSTHLRDLTEGAPAQLLRRLQALYHHGWLDRPRCQIDFFHQGGSRPMAYCLGSRGAALMRREHDTPFSQMVWSREGRDVGRYFLDHALMVSDVLVAVELACRGEAAARRFVAAEALTAAQGKGELFRWNVLLAGKRVGLVPDGVFGLTDEAGNLHIVFLEADRGTMPITRCGHHLSSISRKLAAYAALWKAGKFAEQFGTNRFTVLMVTTGGQRAESIRKAVAGLPSGAGLFRCCCLAELIARPSLVWER